MKGLIHFRRTPKSELREMRPPFNQLFDRFFLTPFGGGDGLWPELYDSRGDGMYAPSIEVNQTPETVVVRADLPGVDPKDVDLELLDDVLVLSGKREEKQEKKEGESTFSEFRFGSFRRTVELPSPVDPDAVKATCEKGVLTIELEKSASSKTRKIPIETR